MQVQLAQRQSPVTQLKTSDSVTPSYRVRDTAALQVNCVDYGRLTAADSLLF